ncbi:MAG: hypothetical protein MHM6MM_003190 [Cercozoa sp. M6MM]
MVHKRRKSTSRFSSPLWSDDSEIKLQSSNSGRYLRILPDGSIDCRSHGNTDWARFTVTHARNSGCVRLRNIGDPSHFLGIDRQGRLLVCDGGKDAELVPLCQGNNKEQVALHGALHPGQFYHIGCDKDGNMLKPSRVRNDAEEATFVVSEARMETAQEGCCSSCSCLVM